MVPKVFESTVAANLAVLITAEVQRHRSQVVIGAWLWCRKLPEGREITPRFRNQQQMGIFF